MPNKISGTGHTDIVARVLQNSSLGDEGEKIYQGFLDNNHVIPVEMRDRWMELIGLCGKSNRLLGSAARNVPVAKGILQSFSQFLDMYAEVRGTASMWAHAVTAAGGKRPEWLDRSIAAHVKSILRDNIEASPETIRKLNEKIFVVLGEEFKMLTALMQKADILERDLNNASSTGIKISDRIKKKLQYLAKEVGAADFHIVEMDDSVARYEGLVYPDCRTELARSLRTKLWPGVIRVDPRSETPIIRLYRAAGNIASTRAGTVLKGARAFGILF